MDPQTQASGNAPKSKFTSRIIILVVVILLGVAVYYASTSGMFSSLGVSGGSVLASVNGADITQSDVEERIAHAKTGLEAQGINFTDPATRDVLESQALEEIINETLVLNDAQAKGIAVTEEEVEAQYAQVRSRFDSDALFAEELSKNSFTEASLRENIRRELTLQKYVSGIASSTPLEVTQAEVVAFYESLKGQTENLPPLADVTAEIENQLRNQKLIAAVDSVVNTLRASAEIVMHTQTSTDAPAAP